MNGALGNGTKGQHVDACDKIVRHNSGTIPFSKKVQNTLLTLSILKLLGFEPQTISNLFISAKDVNSPKNQ